MSRIVGDTVTATLFIVEQLKQIEFDHLQSTAEILPLELMRPYEMPLGDI